MEATGEFKVAKLDGSVPYLAFVVACRYGPYTSETHGQRQGRRSKEHTTRHIRDTCFSA